MSQNFIDQILNRKSWEDEPAAEVKAEVQPTQPTATYDHDVYEAAVPPVAISEPDEEDEYDDHRRAMWTRMADADLAQTLNNEGTIYNEALQTIKEGRARMREIVVEASRRGVSTMTLHRLTALSRPTIEAWRTDAGYPSNAARSLPLGDVSDPVDTQKV